MYKLLWLHLCVEYISICNQFIDECHLVGDINLKGFNFSLTVFYVMLNSFFFFFLSWIVAHFMGLSLLLLVI